MRVPRWLARALALLALPWLASVRVARVGRGRVDALQRDGAPVVYALWHADLALLLGGHGGDGCAVLVSQSRDGAALTWLLERLGYAVVRGSSSRGGVRGLLGLRRALAAGLAPTLAVDGPRGPARTVQGGALALARSTGAVIVPVAAASRREGRLRSWDRTRIPFPGTRAVVVYGRPVRIERGADLQVEAAKLGQRLDSSARTARRLAG